MTGKWIPHAVYCAASEQGNSLILTGEVTELADYFVWNKEANPKGEAQDAPSKVPIEVRGY